MIECSVQVFEEEDTPPIKTKVLIENKKTVKELKIFIGQVYLI